MSQPVALGAAGRGAETLKNVGKSRDLSQIVATGQTGQTSEGDGARTRNLRIDSPVL